MTAWTDVIGWTLRALPVGGHSHRSASCAGVLRVLRQASAHARYVAACTGLLAALTAPPVTVVVLTMSGAPVWTGAARETATPVASVRGRRRTLRRPHITGFAARSAAAG